MAQSTQSVTSPPRLAMTRVLAFTTVLTLAGAQARAQSLDLLVSTSADSTLSSTPVRDQDLVSHASGSGGAYISWSSETLSLIAGELTGSGLHHVFGDIDALHDAGGVLSHDGLYLSTVSNEAGFLDGDVLRGGDDGFSVFLSEADIAVAVGLVDGNLDIDAFHLDADGRVLFSLAENEASSLLSGDNPGVIGDGDILELFLDGGSAAIVFPESAVDAMVSQALGTSSATGDVKGLARDPATGALLFTVQSPSAHDASVFSTAGGGMLVPGQEEPDFGFGGAVELDALTVSQRSWAGLLASDGKPAVGAPLNLELHGAAPNQVFVLFMAFDWGPSLVSTGGWGGLVLTNDLMFQAFQFRILLTDGLGEAQLGLIVPLGTPPTDVTVQAVGVPTPYSATNPVLVEIAQ